MHGGALVERDMFVDVGKYDDLPFLVDRAFRNVDLKIIHAGMTEQGVGNVYIPAT